MQRLRTVLRYEPDAGRFIWLIRPRHRSRIGDVAGTRMENGYISITIDQERFLAHRLAWFYITGARPVDQVDHRNGHRDDNRFINLREADQTINSQNLRRAQSRSTTGFLGVFPWGTRYLARIHANGRYHRLGVFDTPEQAHRVYIAAKRSLHAGCTI